MRRRAERVWWQSNPVLFVVCLLFPGIGLMAVAAWPGVERTRRLDVIVRCLLIAVVWALVYLFVGSLSDDQVRDRLIVTGAVLLMLTILLTPIVRKRSRVLAPPFTGQPDETTMKTFVLELYDELPDKRSFKDIAIADYSAWEAGRRTAVEAYNRERPAEAANNDVAEQSASSCLGSYIPEVRSKGDPHNPERMTVFCLGYVWTFTNLVDDRNAGMEERWRDVSARPWWI